MPPTLHPITSSNNASYKRQKPLPLRRRQTQIQSQNPLSNSQPQQTPPNSLKTTKSLTQTSQIYAQYVISLALE